MNSEGNLFNPPSTHNNSDLLSHLEESLRWLNLSIMYVHCGALGDSVASWCGCESPRGRHTCSAWPPVPHLVSTRPPYHTAKCSLPLCWLAVSRCRLYPTNGITYRGASGLIWTSWMGNNILPGPAVMRTMIKFVDALQPYISIHCYSFMRIRFAKEL